MMLSVPGYGHIFPRTIAGKMFCIVYALVGIPILLVFMAKIGDLMGDGFRWTYRFELVLQFNLGVISVLVCC